jgi:Tetratricopeptide repeat
VAQGIAVAQRALALIEEHLGPEHPDTLATRYNLGGAYESAGQLDNAIPAYGKTLAERERIFGPEHPDTVASRQSLAAVQLVARVRADDASDWLWPPRKGTGPNNRVALRLKPFQSVTDVLAYELQREERCCNALTWTCNPKVPGSRPGRPTKVPGQWGDFGGTFPMRLLRSQQLAERPPLRRCSHRVRRPPVGYALHICRTRDVCEAPHKAAPLRHRDGGTPGQIGGSPNGDHTAGQSRRWRGGRRCRGGSYGLSPH